MEIIDELLKVTQVLETRQVPYAICGGLAVAIHGRPRLTVDIDLLVPATQLRTAVAAVAEAGFDMETGWVKLPESGLGSDRLFRLTKIVGSEFLNLDLLEVDSTENAIWNDQVRVQIKGRQTSVLTKGGLIRMKSCSSRTKDRLDIELLTDEPDTD